MDTTNVLNSIGTSKQVVLLSFAVLERSMQRVSIVWTFGVSVTLSKLAVSPKAIKTAGLA